MESSPATPDSFVTFFAETSLLCALSTCPGGDLSAWGWHQVDPAPDSHAHDETTMEKEEGEEGKKNKADMKSTCRAIRVEVFEIVDEVRGEVLRNWTESRVSGYKGMHGMGIPVGEA